MSDLSLSEAERTFIIHGVEDDLRCDGRRRDDFRHLELETGVVSNTNGSCRLRLGETDLLVGVKAELGEPHPSTPSCGRLEFFVDCSANAAPEFEGRGGEQLAQEISNILANSIGGGGGGSAALDLRSLCVIPREQCWILYVDVVVLECGGNLTDSVSIAVKAALFDAKVPRVRVRVDKETEVKEVELSDDPYDCLTLDVRLVPLLVTTVKIGHGHVVDATREEEACSLARVLVGVVGGGSGGDDDGGRLSHVRKAGRGALDPKSVEEMTAAGRRVGLKLNNALMAALEREKALGEERRIRGFLD